MEFVALVPVSLALASAFVTGIKNVQDKTGKLKELGEESELLLRALNDCCLMRDQYRKSMRDEFHLPATRHIRAKFFTAEKKGWKALGSLALSLPRIVQAKTKGRSIAGVFHKFTDALTGNTTLQDRLHEVREAEHAISLAVITLRTIGPKTHPRDESETEPVPPFDSNSLSLMEDLADLINNIYAVEDIMTDLAIDPCDKDRRSRARQPTNELHSCSDKLQRATSVAEFGAAFADFANNVIALAKAFGEGA